MGDRSTVGAYRGAGTVGALAVVSQARSVESPTPATPAAWFWGLVAAGVALDQAAKVAVLCSFELGQSVTVIPDFFYLTYVLNPGAAFGLGRSLGSAGPWILGILNAVIIGVIIRLRSTATPPAGGRMFALAMGLILAGAFGNIIDRVHPPFKVIDFLDFYIGTPGATKLHWPTFNVADIFIVAGVGVYIYWAWRSERAAKAANAEGEKR